MSSLILSALVRANFVASAAILLVLLLRRPVRRRFGAHAAYALWLIAPFSLIGAFLPGQAPATPFAPILLAATAAANRATPPLTAPGLAPMILGLWIAGAGAAAIVISRRQIQFLRSLGRTLPSTTDANMLRAERMGAGPAVVGVFRPKIVVPADFDLRFQSEARRLVLTHERIHLARGDATINALAAVFQCLAWFNPLVHFGAIRMRMDQELSCDAVVVSRFPEARRLYGQALLETQLASQALPLGCHWPAAGDHPLKERVLMLNSPLPSTITKLAAASLVVALAGAGAGLAWAADSSPPLVAQPAWISHPTAEHVKMLYPAHALKAGQSGSALIDCNVGNDGLLRDCRVQEESPSAAGFGAAAIRMSRYFQMEPVGRDGAPTSGGHVRVPIRFFPQQP